MFKPSDRYGDRLNSYDAVKLLALVTMIIDHAGAYLFPQLECMRAVGRMAFPLFLFLVGYSGSWKVKADLLAWAGLVIAVATTTHHGFIPFNVLAGIALTRYAMPYLAKGGIDDTKLIGIFVGCTIWFLPTAFLADYGSFAILFAVCGYRHRHNPRAPSTRLFIVTTLALHFYIQIVSFHFAFAATKLLTALIGLLTLSIMLRFSMEEYAPSAMPVFLRRALQFLSRNTLALYGLHVMLFMSLEYVWFHDRVAVFRWWL